MRIPDVAAGESKGYLEDLADREAALAEAAPPAAADKPGPGTRKAGLQEWLDQQGIDYPADATKPELRAIVDAA